IEAQIFQIFFDIAEKLEIDQELIHWRIADSFAYSKCSAVNTVDAGFISGNRVNHSESSILVAVPVYLHLLAGFGNDLFDKSYESRNACWCRVSHGITDADATCAALDSGRVELANSVGMCARGVLGHIHYRQVMFCGEADCVFCGVKHLV